MSTASTPADTARPHVRLRPFREADAPAVHALIAATIDASYAGVYPPRAIAFFKRHHSLDEIRQRARNGCTVVVEEPRHGAMRIVATGTLVDTYIGGVFVESNLQRSGHGRAVMEHLEARARHAGIPEITLDVSLPARGFYERLGYVLSDLLRRDMGEGETLDYWLGRKALVEAAPTDGATPTGATRTCGGSHLMDAALAHSLYRDDDAAVSALDELSLWAAPFGLRLLDLFEMGHDLRVLDLGFGTGFPLLELAGRLGPSSTVTGLDPWSAGHRRTRAKLAQIGLANVELVEGTAEQMPFADASFHRVVSNNGFNNVANMRRAFREAARVSRSGAQLIFTMNTEDSMHELHEVFRAVFAARGLADATTALAAYIDNRRKPLAEVRAHVEAAGFAIEKLQHDQFAFRYADGAALFAHPFVRIAFLEGWHALVPAERRDDVFREIETRLDDLAAADPATGVRMSIPFVTVVARRQSIRG